MSLTLKVVPAVRGLQWVRDAFVQFGRRPLAFTGLFIVFLLAAMLATVIPLVGGLLQMMMLPMLSLGFMLATQAGLHGEPVHPRAFVDPLRADAVRRRSLLQLCALYGVCAVAILLLCDQLSDHAMLRLQELLAKGDTTRAQVDALLGEPGVTHAALAGTLLATLLSVPFWHAPALVHWGRQRPGQALFSSTLAVWRAKGAFAVYALAWAGLVFGFGVLTAVLFGLFGARQLTTLVAVPAGLMFSTVFYVSLLFTFNDSFGDSRPEAPPGP